MPTLLFKANEELSLIREILLDYKTRSWFSIIQNFKTIYIYIYIIYIYIHIYIYIYYIYIYIYIYIYRPS